MKELTALQQNFKNEAIKKYSDLLDKVFLCGDEEFAIKVDLYVQKQFDNISSTTVDEVREVKTTGRVKRNIGDGITVTPPTREDAPKKRPTKSKEMTMDDVEAIDDYEELSDKELCQVLKVLEIKGMTKKPKAEKIEAILNVLDGEEAEENEEDDYDVDYDDEDIEEDVIEDDAPIEPTTTLRRRPRRPRA